jgi:hypothetical protein
VQVALPDLTEAGVFEPPVRAKPGDKFLVTDVAANGGPVIAAASTTRYDLSKDGTKGPGDILLTGTRPVPALNPSGQPGSQSNGTMLVTIPTNAASGAYRLLACAEDGYAVKETSETNNCVASFGSMQVAR